MSAPSASKLISPALSKVIVEPVIVDITGLVNVLLVNVCEASFNVMLDVFDKSVDAIVIAAEPSKFWPAIALAVASVVAVSALPVTAPVTLPVTLPVTSPVKSPVTSPVTLPVRLPVTLPVTLPVRLPVTLPVTLPSKFATKVPVVIVKLPVEAPVNEPVPTLNLSALSSYPINALSELPLSITIPASFEGLPEVPFPNSNSVSETTVLVVDTVVVVPLTVKLPVIVAFLVTDKSLPIVTSSGNAIVTLLSVTVAVISFVVPENVSVSDNNETVSVVDVSSLIVKFVATLTVLAAVKRPCASTVNVGIAVAEP